jgi:hypothetical protein
VPCHCAKVLTDATEQKLAVAESGDFHPVLRPIQWPVRLGIRVMA